MKLATLLLLGVVSAEELELTANEEADGGNLQGGVSEYKEIGDDDESLAEDFVQQGVLDQIIASIQGAGENLTCDTWTPLRYTTQVVAGTLYKVVYNCGPSNTLKEATVWHKVDQTWEVTATRAVEEGSEAAGPADDENAAGEETEGNALLGATNADPVDEGEETGESDAEAECAGCWTDMTNITADGDEAELYEYFLGLKESLAEQFTNNDLAGLRPFRYSSQLVAGTNYDVLYVIGDEGDLLEAKITKNLDNETIIRSVQLYEETALASSGIPEEEHPDIGAAGLLASLSTLAAVAMASLQ